VSIVSEVARINRECFTNDDPFSSEKYLASMIKLGVELATIKQDGKIVGFIIFQDLGTHIESLRRALTKHARGKGQGVKLTKRLIAIAKKRGLGIYTYVAKTNLPSLNSNLKCGYRIENISEDWVYIRYKTK
jgi:ribosomal protein S18 acetylase RimI-like enzyme